VTAIRTKATDHRRSLTLPFPEPGVRLIKQEKVDEFAAALADSRAELADAVRNLDARYAELRRAAADRLGSLFNPSDYPETLGGLFDVAWDLPSIEPPDFLVALSPRVYERRWTRRSSTCPRGSSSAWRWRWGSARWSVTSGSW
jgi:hypothetical protein